MPSPQNIAESFRDLDFHDYTFLDVRVLPGQVRGETKQPVVEIQLLQYWEKKLSSIRFSGCANLRVAMDFDVLTQNLPCNTSGVDAHAHVDRLRDLMQSQTKDWDVQYAPGVVSPLTKKLAAMDDLVCFRVQFCGGTVEVIARDYEVLMVEKE